MSLCCFAWSAWCSFFVKIKIGHTVLTHRFHVWADNVCYYIIVNSKFLFFCPPINRWFHFILKFHSWLNFKLKYIRALYVALLWQATFFMSIIWVRYIGINRKILWGSHLRIITINFPYKKLTCCIYIFSSAYRHIYFACHLLGLHRVLALWNAHDWQRVACKWDMYFYA